MTSRFLVVCWCVTFSIPFLTCCFRISHQEQSADGGSEVEDEDEDEVVIVQLDEAVNPSDGAYLPERVSCAAHTLQLVVKDALAGSGHGAVSRAITRLNTFVGATRKSTVAMEVICEGIMLASDSICISFIFYFPFRVFITNACKHVLHSHGYYL